MQFGPKSIHQNGQELIPWEVVAVVLQQHAEGRGLDADYRRKNAFAFFPRGSA